MLASDFALVNAHPNPDGSRIIAHDPLRNAGWLLGLFAFDRYTVHGFNRIGEFFQTEQHYTRPYSGVSADRGGKSHTVQSIIHREPHITLDLDRRFQEMADQREGKKPVSDRRAIRRFFASPRLVQMNPLPAFC